MNKTGINIINATSISNYKINTDVNENVSFTNAKHKEMFGIIQEATSPNNSIDQTPYLEVDQEHITKLEQIVSSSPRLILEVINQLKEEVIGNSSFHRYSLKINAQGIEGSLRGKKDGFTFFGFENNEKRVKYAWQ